MDIILKISYLVLNLFFLLIYILNMIYSLIRDLRAKKQLKTNPLSLKGYVNDFKSAPKRDYLVIQFTSPQNLIKFTTTYEFVTGEVSSDDYPKGKEVTLLYNNFPLPNDKITDSKSKHGLSRFKQIKNFPLVIKGLKIKLDKGPLFTNCALIGFSLYNVISLLIRYHAINAFDPNINFINANPEYGIFPSWLPVIIMLVVYTVLSTYLIDSLLSVPKVDNHNYLKIAGYRAKARVVTYKFGRHKNAKGIKESHLTIEFHNHRGELIRTNLSSHLYTTTQEEYIDILYDPLYSKNAVYLIP